MSGSPRDLAAVDPWEASLARSRARRERAAGRSPMRLANMMDARRPSPLAAQSRRGASHGSSRRCARAPAASAAELQFVPTATRARRVSLGTLIALAAGPAAGLADANGITQPAARTSARPEPPTTTNTTFCWKTAAKVARCDCCRRSSGITRGWRLWAGNRSCGAHLPGRSRPGSRTASWGRGPAPRWPTTRSGRDARGHSPRTRPSAPA